MERMALPQITWDDVLQMPEDRNRYEAIEGELYVTPAPSSRHQRVSMALAVALHRILVGGGHGELFHAPYGVKFPSTGEGVQPDLVFVSGGRREIILPAQIEGAPDLVVEILSPSTAGRDRGVKRKLYERQGVGEYWIVDAEAGAVDVWRFGALRRAPSGSRSGFRCAWATRRWGSSTSGRCSSRCESRAAAGPASSPGARPPLLTLALESPSGSITPDRISSSRHRSQRRWRSCSRRASSGPGGTSTRGPERCERSRCSRWTVGTSASTDARTGRPSGSFREVWPVRGPIRDGTGVPRDTMEACGGRLR